MAITVKHSDGKADETKTATGTVSYQLYGPPPSGAPNHQGVFIAQVAGATGTYRFLEERYTPGTASPSSYSYA